MSPPVLSHTITTLSKHQTHAPVKRGTRLSKTGSVPGKTRRGRIGAIARRRTERPDVSACSLPHYYHTFQAPNTCSGQAGHKVKQNCECTWENEAWTDRSDRASTHRAPRCLRLFSPTLLPHFPSTKHMLRSSGAQG